MRFVRLFRLVSMTCCLLSGMLLCLAWGEVMLRFPTDNQALIHDKPQDFYMYVDREFEGEKSQPWQGGAYGFTRTLVRTQAGVIPIKFHEGIDIKPVRRDAKQEPLDEVRPVAAGTVVHVSALPGHSNYGRYVVIEHRLPDGPLYSLYAHLASVNCQVGDCVGTGNVIGKLGYSGVGLNKTRAHLHLELALKLQDRFDQWYADRKFGTPNRHGVYNGINLAGFDPAPVLLACNRGEEFVLARHIAALPVQYVVLAPAGNREPGLLKNYPFLRKPGAQNPQSWEIHLTGEGVPVALVPSAESCTEPKVIKANPLPYTQLYRTCRRVSGSSKDPVLTNSGKNYIQLIMQE